MAGLLDDHDVVLAVLTQVEFGEVEAFDARSLELREDTRSAVCVDDRKELTTSC